LKKRLFYCEKEVLLNKRLCEGMYFDVVPITNSREIKVGGHGETVEYAVKMKKISQDRMLNKLLDKNQVTYELIDEIAKKISTFHLKAETNEVISDFGSQKIIENNWNENFEQTIEFIGKTIQKYDLEFIHQRITDFEKRNRTFFEKRITEGKIRDCHGDIHSGNIFVDDKIYIFDAIEFNDRFRYADVASDVAFLAMDLDFKKRQDLSDFFVKKYREYSSDEDLCELLSFYKCYRAYVRGKVVSFKLKDPNIVSEERATSAKEAKEYFALAADYARKF
jgi:aminoglycoside phosphotransferase family enzyme